LPVDAVQTLSGAVIAAETSGTLFVLAPRQPAFVAETDSETGPVRPAVKVILLVIEEPAMVPLVIVHE
jgi:hypothetical protein